MATLLPGKSASQLRCNPAIDVKRPPPAPVPIRLGQARRALADVRGWSTR